jgi:signal recognition particle subunit SRP54
MPGMSDMMPPDANLDDGELVEDRGDHLELHEVRAEATPTPSSASRRACAHREGLRAAREAGEELVQKFLFMKQMMEGLGRTWGCWATIPGMKNLAMAKNLRKQMAQGGMPGMGIRDGGLPGMPGMGACREWGWGLPGDARHGRHAGGARREHDQDEAALDGGEEREEGAAEARERCAPEEPAVRVTKSLDPGAKLC